MMKITITHNLDRMKPDLQAERKRVEAATFAARASTAKTLKERLRAQVTSAGLGGRVAKTWRSKTFNDGDGLNGAAFVWSKAPHIVDGFERGAIVHAKGKRWLAIPTQAAPKRGAGGNRATAANLAGRFKLKFIQVSGTRAVLVAENVRVSERTRRATRQAANPYLKSGQLRSGLASVVMFVLVRQVKLPKKLDVETIAKEGPGLLIKAMAASLKG